MKLRNLKKIISVMLESQPKINITMTVKSSRLLWWLALYNNTGLLHDLVQTRIVQNYLVQIGAILSKDIVFFEYVPKS